MNLRDLEYIDAVARLGQFGKAARACHVSQPTLSGQVRKLEDYLGVQIFERTTKSVRLTPAGERIVALARQALEVTRGIEDLASSLRGETVGSLRLGLIPTIAPYLVPRFIRRLKEAFPALRPILQEDVTERLLTRLHEGALDAAILATETDGRYRELPLYREPFLLAVPDGHALAGRREVTTSDLNPDDLLLLTEGHCFRDQAMEVCRLGDRAAEGTGLAATSLTTLLQLVDMGQGITLVPSLTWDQLRPSMRHVSAHPFADGMAERTVRLVFRKGHPQRATLEKVASIIRDSVPAGMRCPPDINA
jgi:LysR family hydrogen peroxide-inducible transcriptional activator